ncbi:hypothetical protein M758_UG163900 [Ceratodon purpureus]|nr:hypothetical protein M758_UG163900 [Ceratodon purpureus]
MELSTVSDYESMLYDEHDGHDRWWFLEKTSIDGIPPSSSDESSDEGSIVPGINTMDSVKHPSDTSGIGSLECGVTLGISEMNLIDCLCTKFRSPAMFKAKLVRVVLAIHNPGYPGCAGGYSY